MAILSSSYSSTVFIQNTPWSSSIFSLPQFDQVTYGTLLSMSVQAATVLRSTARVENVTTVSVVVVYGVSGSVVMYDTSGSALVSAYPLVVWSSSLGPYDGVADFGGLPPSRSGVSNPYRTRSATTSASVASFNDYIGTGYATFSVSASATGHLSGAENYLLQVAPQAGGTFTVTYTYEALPESSGISGYVWNDYNATGAWEPGEPGMSGVTLTLLDEFGLPISGGYTTVTDANGYYEFTSSAGNYYVVYDAPVGYGPTYDIDGVDWTNSFYVTVPNNSTVVTDMNVGLSTLSGTLVGTLVGFTFNDANNDGLVDDDLAGVSSVSLQLWNETEDTLIDSTTSDVTGSFTFSNIAPGNYYVKYIVPSGYVVTTDGDGVDSQNKIGIIVATGSYQELYIGFYQEPVAPTVFIPSNLVNGSAYIYDLKKLVKNRKVGNVFYKNGKFIFSNSGSVFDDLLKDRSNLTLPKYDITYKSKQTLYEKQVLCRIEPGEFNYSTNPTALISNEFQFDIDKNNYFTYVDLDLILRYISLKVNSDYQWYNYLSDMFTDDDQSWYDYYSTKYDLQNKDSSYHISYTAYLESIYNSFDVDGNNKIKLADAYLMFKYFTNTLTKDVVFRNIDIRSTRKSVESIVRYMDEKNGKYGYGKIKSEFFNFDYSSSLDKTGSYLAPFITTVGLYSGTELVGVSKLGMPIKNSGELPLNILVKWDI